MPLPNIFSQATVTDITNRINALQSTTTPQWGKMNVGQMLAHCNVTYEMAFENIHPKPNFLFVFILKKFVKSTVVNEVPYKKSSGTAPAFIQKTNKDFDAEKARLIAYLNKTVSLGEQYFDGKESLSFGKLSITEWNNMFYKHVDHHLGQFGV